VHAQSAVTIAAVASPAAMWPRTRRAHTSGNLPHFWVRYTSSGACRELPDGFAGVPCFGAASAARMARAASPVANANGIGVDVPTAEATGPSPLPPFAASSSASARWMYSDAERQTRDKRMPVDAGLDGHVTIGNTNSSGGEGQRNRPVTCVEGKDDERARVSAQSQRQERVASVSEPTCSPSADKASGISSGCNPFLALGATSVCP
jgi:hypothetical protein